MLEEGPEFERTPGEFAPPLSGAQQAAAQEEVAISPPGEPLPKQGWVPLKPVAVIPILRLEGDYLSWRTGWQGWCYSEPDLQAMGELIEELGITAPAWAQLFGAIVGLHGAKFICYKDWVHRGEPGKKGGEVVGAVPPPEGR